MTIGSSDARWIASADWNNETGQPVSSFRASWVVPSPPIDKVGQRIYLFNGIGGSDRQCIIQPVLQWGESPGGGGPWWAVASWYVPLKGVAVISDLVPVEPGSRLVGAITLVAQNDGYEYHAEFEGIDGTGIRAVGVQELTLCSLTLEAYDTNRCSHYPDSDATTFNDVDIRVDTSIPPLRWTPTDWIAECGHTNVVVDSAVNGVVEIQYLAAFQETPSVP